MKRLVIVESPAKARTIHRYLGKDVRVIASVGHIRDLPKSKIGVDVEHGFEPQYLIPRDKKKIVTELKSGAKSAEQIYIATDPDREGEAIAWHIAEILDADPERIHRVLFQQITRQAVQAAMNKPGRIDADRVEAQQTRRILDRLMGYHLSPLLWKKVRRGLSAGRVQSVALRMICDRESEREAFVSEEYWTFTAELEADQPPVFKASLEKLHGKKAKISTEEEARALENELRAGTFTVNDVSTAEKKKTPPPPFTTAKLQQEAHRRFRFPVKKTMKLAQALYEGKNLGEHGEQGLITYMRTDSLRIAPEALDEARNHIMAAFGSEYLPSKPRIYKNKNSIQDAHEAIRPSSVELTPELVKPHLSPEEWKLYALIYSRFVASQMAPAVLDHTEIKIDNGPAMFKAKGDVVTFPGYFRVYGEAENGKDDPRLPAVKPGQDLDLADLEVKQNFTQPPPRYTEATLVKALEEKGIGRPSTYASIISTIQTRDYCLKDDQALVPTQLGRTVNTMLVSSFPDIINEAYTANLEGQLDQIEAGDAKRFDILTDFFKKFTLDLDEATKSIERVRGIPIEEPCPKCGKELLTKFGKKGQFIGCSNYPECDFTRDITADDAEPCEKCGSPMVLKRGRFGQFYACSGYPDCKNTRKFKTAFKAEDTGVACPREGCEGRIVSRISKKGKVFYGCSAYPKCDFAMWSKPLPEPCPICGSPYQIIKGKKTVCPAQETHPEN